jgi:hypothetical protein
MYVECAGVQCGHCYRTTVDVTEAMSPAFLGRIPAQYISKIRPGKSILLLTELLF